MIIRLLSQKTVSNNTKKFPVTELSARGTTALWDRLKTLGRTLGAISALYESHGGKVLLTVGLLLKEKDKAGNNLLLPANPVRPTRLRLPLLDFGSQLKAHWFL